MNHDHTVQLHLLVHTQHKQSAVAPPNGYVSFQNKNDRGSGGVRGKKTKTKQKLNNIARSSKFIPKIPDQRQVRLKGNKK